MFNRIRAIPRKLWNNKWKTLFGTGAITWVAHWKWGDYLHSLELDEAIQAALIEGNKPAITSKLEKVTVILNPHAGSGFARQSYEANAQPVLECAGYDIRLLKTEYVKHERDLAHDQVDPDTDILIIAGGDTTVMNVLTGLNRRPDFDAKFKSRNFKIAILPLGATNRIWQTFSSKKTGSFEAPYDRQNRITEAAANIGIGVCDLKIKFRN